MNTESITAVILDFLREKKIPFRLESIEQNSSLPGINLDLGVLIIDQSQLSYPGDILHAAGYIAVTAPSERDSLSGKITGTPAEEMAAMAWSYAAAIELQIDPHIVFHEDGYKGGGAQLAAQYAEQAAGLLAPAPGVPMLQWFRMTENFPHMSQWLRSVDDPTKALPAN